MAETQFRGYFLTRINKRMDAAMKAASLEEFMTSFESFAECLSIAADLNAVTNSEFEVYMDIRREVSITKISELSKR